MSHATSLRDYLVPNGCILVFLWRSHLTKISASLASIDKIFLDNSAGMSNFWATLYIVSSSFCAEIPNHVRYYKVFARVWWQPLDVRSWHDYSLVTGSHKGRIQEFAERNGCHLSFLFPSPLSDLSIPSPSPLKWLPHKHAKGSGVAL